MFANWEYLAFALALASATGAVAWWVATTFQKKVDADEMRQELQRRMEADKAAADAAVRELWIRMNNHHDLLTKVHGSVEYIRGRLDPALKP